MKGKTATICYEKMNNLVSTICTISILGFAVGCVSAPESLKPRTVSSKYSMNDRKSKDEGIIKIDGKDQDWINKEPIITDPTDDVRSKIRGADIENIYLFQDSNFLYVMFKSYPSKSRDVENLSYTFYIDDSAESEEFNVRYQPGANSSGRTWFWDFPGKTKYEDKRNFHHIKEMKAKSGIKSDGTQIFEMKIPLTRVGHLARFKCYFGTFLRRKPLDLTETIIYPKIVPPVKGERKPWIGINIDKVTPELAKKHALNKAEGALVVSRVENSPAERAGLEKGDIILEFNNTPIKKFMDLPPLVISATRPGDEVPLVISRNGRTKHIVLIMGTLAIGDLEKDTKSAEAAKRDTTPPVIEITSPKTEAGVGITVKNKQTEIRGIAKDESKINYVKVNSKNALLKDGNNFLIDVDLRIGKNKFEIEAADVFKNIERKTLSITRLPTPKKPTKLSIAEKEIGTKFAVIIGIGKYQDDRIPNLKYTRVDAESIYNILTDPQRGNFPKDQIKLLIDEQATYYNIKSAIGTWLRRNTRKHDTVIIFYAGHGAPEDEKTYWVTYNANIDDLYGTALSNDEIADMLDRVEANKMIAFLDSCYSAATVNRTDKKRSIMIKKDPFQKFKGKGRVIITSSDGKEESLEIEKFGHGVFTYYLLEALKGESDENKDGFVELDEVWDYVKYRVTDTARKHGSTQTPIIGGSYSAGIVLSKYPERLKKLYLEAEREKKEKELEVKIAKLTELYSKGEITSGQFDKAVRTLELGEKNKLLDDFLSDRISLITFKRVFNLI